MKKRPSKLARISPDVFVKVQKRASKRRLSARQELDSLVERGMESEDAKGGGK